MNFLGVFLGIFNGKPARIPGKSYKRKYLQTIGVSWRKSLTNSFHRCLRKCAARMVQGIICSVQRTEPMMPCTMRATRPEGRFWVLAVQHDGVSIVLAVSQVFRNNTGSLVDTLRAIAYGSLLRSAASSRKQQIHEEHKRPRMDLNAVRLRSSCTRWGLQRPAEKEAAPRVGETDRN